jgi:uncharacterized protein YegP (UPF0339 family)
MASTFEIYADAGERFRWRFVASNGQAVGSSGESFASKANATEAAENVKANAGSATVEDARAVELLSPRLPCRASRLTP